MRCLHVYSGNLFGGVERVLITLAGERANTRALDHDIALAFDGDLAGRLRAAGITPHILGPVHARNPLTIARARRALARIIAATAPDALICHGAWAHLLLGSTASRAGIPLVWWVHGAFNAAHWLDRFAASRPADLVICNSAFTRSTVTGHVGSTPVRVIFNPVSVAEVSGRQREHRRRQMGVRPGEKVVMQAGRMEPSKGHEILLRALARLRDRTDWVLWEVGAPQRPREVRYLNTLRRLAADLGLADRVHFVGRRDDVTELIAAADVYAQANIAPEGFGLTLVEAMLSGVPVVTSALGAAQELVDDTCGILVPPGDISVLTTVIGRLLDDERARRHLGSGGPSRGYIVANPAARLHDLAIAVEDLMRGRRVA